MYLPEMHRILLLLSLLLTACPAQPAGGGGGGGGDDDDDAGSEEDPTLTLVTNLGELRILVYEEDSPRTAGNFLQYVDDGFYDGSDGAGATVFHRVIPDFMAQGGGFTVDDAEKASRDPIANEALESGLENLRGTLSMARTANPDSGTSQFFINVVHNAHLDPGSAQTPDGHAVFGEVTSGMDVVDQMTEVATNGSTPVDAIVVESFTRD
jgi:cyclophilin family peptidyl-prolyl cis-trans isomerase